MAKAKTTDKTSIPVQIYSKCIFQAQTTVPAAFLNYDKSRREILLFQNLVNCAIEKLSPKLQLEGINLKCNDMLKGKYQMKNLTEFKCILSFKYD